LFQYLTKKLGADAQLFGYLQTAFAVAQLLGGPLYGRLGDVFGERQALLVAFTASAASYTILGLATSVPALFFSRIPSAFMHVMQGSQMMTASTSSESSRATALSRLGFSFGMGMIVGPALGGQITKYYR